MLGLGRLFSTAKAALIPVVAADHHLIRANSLSGGAGMIAALLGGAAGIGLSGAAGSPVAFGAAAVIYLLAAGAARSLSSPYAHPAARGAALRDQLARVAREALVGVRAVSARAAAWVPLVALFLVRVLVMLGAIAAILVIKSEFPGSADRGGRLGGSALALGAAGVGAFLAAFATAAWEKRLRTKTMIVGGVVLTGVGITVLAASNGIAPLVVATAIAGFGAFVTKVAVDAALQRELPDDLRGRGFALYDILYNSASVAAAGVIAVAGIGGARPSLFGAALVAGGAAAWLFSSTP